MTAGFTSVINVTTGTSEVSFCETTPPDYGPPATPGGLAVSSGDAGGLYNQVYPLYQKFEGIIVPTTP